MLYVKFWVYIKYSDIMSCRVAVFLMKWLESNVAVKIWCMVRRFV